MTQKQVFLGLSVGLFIFFILFSYFVSKELFTQTDFDLTVKLQDQIPRRVDYPFSILSVLGSLEISMFFWGLLLFFCLIKKYWLAALSLTLLPLALLMELFGKLFVLHPAPPNFFYRGVIKLDVPAYYIHTDYSYPSGHVTRTAFIIFFLITFLQLRSPKKYRLPIQLSLVFFLGVMLISRIYLGEHWTTDVIGGLLIGTSFGILAGIFIPDKKLQSRNSGS
ncbi:MAG: hypothetical protein ACD_30C00033G0002 [uncultured bacterium]|nr:MAG: hypothetical protein ACD_30C00033G0002 [uncultured bacterium]